MACSKGTCITLRGTTYFQNYFVIECSYLLKTVSTIELVFCGHILQNIIIRKKKEWTSSSGPLGDSKHPFMKVNSRNCGNSQEGGLLWVLIVGRDFLVRFGASPCRKWNLNRQGREPLSWKETIKNIGLAVSSILGYEGSQEISEIKVRMHSKNNCFSNKTHTKKPQGIRYPIKGNSE